MDMFIYDLHESAVDDFINPSCDKFGRITRRASEHNRTVDLVIHIVSVTVGISSMYIEFPNGNGAFIKIDSCMYHKIEVM